MHKIYRDNKDFLHITKAGGEFSFYCTITDSEVICGEISENPAGSNNYVSCSIAVFLYKEKLGKKLRFFVAKKFGSANLERVFQECNYCKFKDAPFGEDIEIERRGNPEEPEPSAG